MRLKCEELEKETLKADFWAHPKEAEQFIKNLNPKKSILEKFDAMQQSFEDLTVIYEFYESGEAKESEIEDLCKNTQKHIEEIEFFRMFNDEEDKLCAILTINAGAGGTESQDWAEMLMRMYVRWAERNKFSVKELDSLKGDGAGYKNISLEIEGEFAYGKLKCENGVHRLVRLSPFDANNKRHTSFASVYAYPLVDENINISINKADLEWDTFRSSGPGGQNVNKLETAVRVRHLPSNIVVECQVTRSQAQNREKALQMLKSRLYEIEIRKKQDAISEKEDSKMKIEWGSQIRSYVLYPYKMVKDTRTGFETSNAQAVLDGDIDEFIKSFLLKFGKK